MEDKHKYRNRYKRYRERLLFQRIIAWILIALSCVFCYLLRGTGEDGSALLITFPMGVYLLFSKKIWIG